MPTNSSKVLEDKAQTDHRFELLSSALEELKNLRAAELFEIEKQKRQLYGRKSEKSSSLRKGTGRDLKKDKDDFDRSNPPAVSCDESSAALLSDMNIDTSSHSVYKPADPDDTLSPFENVLPGYHVDLDMISQILVDKYQYSMSLERVVDRFKDVDAEFSSSTVLNWVHRHIRELEKLVVFFARQPEGAFEFFKPHEFDGKAIRKVVKNKAFLTFVVLKDDAIVGYFFLRCFVNGKCFRGKIVHEDWQGRGIAKLMGWR